VSESRRPDEEANLQALDNETIRARQPEQIPFEGGKPKKQLPLVGAYFVNAVVFFLPLRLRVKFIYAMNFLYNNPTASLRMAFGWIGMRFTYLLIWLTYYLVLGPTALVARLLGYDELGLERDEPSFYTDKEPADTTEARFLRQY
jgi:hypothetical protein